MSSFAQASSLPAPSIEYGQLSPMLIVFGVGIAAVLVEAFLPQRARYGTHLVLSLGGLVAAFIAIVVLAGTRHAAVMGAVAIDGPTLFLQGTIVLISLLAVLFMAERRLQTHAAERELVGAHAGGDAFAARASTVPGSEGERAADAAGATQTEVFPLTLLAVGGMLLFPASNDLLTMFIALEVLSLPLYLLCGLARHRRLLSQESSMKYFLLGAFSSAFFLYGIALLYGFAGTLSLPGIADAVTKSDNTTLALIGIGLLSVGLLFKVGAVPFHSWIPDVYQGAPTPITGFMAAATKVAAFGAMLRIFYVAVPDLRSDWRPAMWAVAIATMLLGSIIAVTQSDMKRMLAYSSIAHAGFILTGVIALNPAGLSATMFYLIAYGVSTIGAFAIVGLVRNSAGEVGDMFRWAGLGRRYPLVCMVFGLYLLTFAGIPLTSGFVAKFAVFKAAVEGGATPLVIVGVISSAIAAFFYVRVIVLMFFSDSETDDPIVVKPSILTSAAIGVSVIVTLVLGIFPQPVLDLADKAGAFIH